MTVKDYILILLIKYNSILNGTNMTSQNSSPYYPTMFLGASALFRSFRTVWLNTRKLFCTQL